MLKWLEIKNVVVNSLVAISISFEGFEKKDVLIKKRVCSFPNVHACSRTFTRVRSFNYSTHVIEVRQMNKRANTCIRKRANACTAKRANGSKSNHANARTSERAMQMHALKS